MDDRGRTNVWQATWWRYFGFDYVSDSMRGAYPSASTLMKDRWRGGGRVLDRSWARSFHSVRETEAPGHLLLSQSTRKELQPACSSVWRWLRAPRRRVERFPLRTLSVTRWMSHGAAGRWKTSASGWKFIPIILMLLVVFNSMGLTPTQQVNEGVFVYLCVFSMFEGALQEIRLKKLTINSICSELNQLWIH